MQRIDLLKFLKFESEYLTVALDKAKQKAEVDKINEAIQQASDGKNINTNALLPILSYTNAETGKIDPASVDEIAAMLTPSEIKERIRKRYGHDISDQSAIAPDWVLGSPYYNLLNKIYKSYDVSPPTPPKKSLWERVVAKLKLAGNFVTTLFTKGIVESLDDILAALKNAALLGNLTQAAFSGILGGIIIFLHGLNAFRGAYYDLYEGITGTENGEKLAPESNSRAYKILSGIGKIGLGLAGVAVGGLFIGLVITLLPVVMFCSSILALGNLVMEYCKTKHFHSEAQKTLVTVSQDNKDSIKNVNAYKTTINNEQGRTEDVANPYKVNPYENLYELGKLKHKQKSNKQKHAQAEENNIKTERDRAFAGAEVGTGTISVAAAGIGLAGFAIANVFTGGVPLYILAALATASLIVGVFAAVTGIGLKTFQFLNEEYGHKATNYLRGIFSSPTPPEVTKPVKVNRTWQYIQEELKKKGGVIEEKADVAKIPENPVIDVKVPEPAVIAANEEINKDDPELKSSNSM